MHEVVVLRKRSRKRGKRWRVRGWRERKGGGQGKKEEKLEEEQEEVK